MTTCPTCGQPIRASREESAPLTPRQYEILVMLADGRSINAICEQLYLARETVRWHIKRAYWELGVHTREDAIDRARSLGLI